MASAGFCQLRSESAHLRNGPPQINASLLYFSYQMYPDMWQVLSPLSTATTAGKHKFGGAMNVYE